MTASDAPSAALTSLGRLAPGIGAAAVAAIAYPDLTRKAATQEHHRGAYFGTARELGITYEAADGILQEEIANGPSHYGFADERVWQRARDRVIHLTAPPMPTPEEMWARALPDVAALGDDSPHVSVRQLPGGALVWSWVRRGERVYEQAHEPMPLWQQSWALAELLRQADGLR